MMDSVTTAYLALRDHMRDFSGQLLASGAAGREFDRLYLVWIQERWDGGDPWVRSVWAVRP